MSNVPKLRFKQYQEKWKQYKIGEIFEKVGKPVDVQDNKKYVEIGIRSHGKGLFYKNSTTKEEIGNKRVFFVEPDCFVVNIVFAWERAVARTTCNETGMIASHRFPMYKPKPDIVSLDYITTYFITKYGQNILIMASPGGAGRNKTLGQKEFANSTIFLPSYDEQIKIATLIKTIDEIIAKSRAEVEAWEKRKKGVIKKLFSQEVRFKADDGSEFPEWEKKRIGDILTIYHGKDYKNLQKGIFPVLGTGGEITRVNQFLCNWPCVVIGRKGTINKPMFIDEPFWSVDTLFYTKNKEGFLPKWEYYLFQNIDWTRYNEASGVPSLSASTINNIKILSPALPEQQKIADCLSSLDEVIKKCKKELAAWEELKKGLLQQMFI